MRLSILSFDAAVCLADFAIRTSFRLSSTFQDMSITPYLISCGATQTATTIVFTLPPSLLLQLCLLPPSIDRSVSRLQLFFSLQPLQLTVLCLPSPTAGQTPLHNPAKGSKGLRSIGAQVPAEICSCFKFFVEKKKLHLSINSAETCLIFCFIFLHVKKPQCQPKSMIFAVLSYHISP